MDKQPSNKWPWSLAIVAVVALAIIIALQINKPFDKDFIAFMELCSHIVIGTVGILFVYYQIREMSKNTYSQIKEMSKNNYSQIEEMNRNTDAALEWNKRIESMKIASTIKDYGENFRKIRAYRTEHDIEPLDKLPRALSDDLVEHVKAVANYFEMIATGIKSDVYKDDILFHSFGNELVKFYSYCSDFIKERHRKIYDTVIWVEFEALAKKWEARISNTKQHVQEVCDPIKQPRTADKETMLDTP